MKNTIGRNVTITAFSALLAALFALGGCASGQQQAQSSASAPSSASAAASSSASAAADVEADLVIGEEASGSAHVMLTNETGSTIDGISFTASGSTDTVALAPSGQEWLDGQTASVSFDAPGSGVCDIEVTIGDEVYVLHDFDADLISSAAIHVEGDVAYVTYELFGNETSTLDAETVRLQAEAAAEPEPEPEPVVETYSYEEPAQSEDACIDGGVVLR